MKALNNIIGRCYSKLNEYYKAKEYFEKSLSISEKISDDELSFDNYTYLIGIECLIEKGSLDVALDYGKKAEILATKLYGNKSSELSEVYSELGSISSEIEEYENALNYYNKSLEVYDKWGEIDFNLAKYHYWKAEALYNSKNYELSKQELLLSHQICKSLPIQSELTAALITYIKDDLKVIYDYNFDGDKSDGFETWYKELISTQPVQ